jgi:hypothetical protein
MAPVTKEELRSIFAEIDDVVLNEVWEHFNGDAEKCLRSCCEMTETPHMDALARLTSKSKLDVQSPVSSAPSQSGPRQEVHCKEAEEVSWETMARAKTEEVPVPSPVNLFRRKSEPQLRPPAVTPLVCTSSPQPPAPVQPRTPLSNGHSGRPSITGARPGATGQRSPQSNGENIVIPPIVWDQTENVIKYAYDVKTDVWTQTPATVYIDPKPFQEGTMRTAFHLFDLSKPEGQQHHVCKISKDPREDTSTYFTDVEMQSFAKLLADEFNKCKPPKMVDFVEASLIKCLERKGQPILAVEPFIPGKYIKHSNNYGFVSEDDRNTPQAFSHFTYCKSRGDYLICDIQGVQDKYTDPQIHSRDGKGFGKGNMGVEGMAKFFQTHHCNAICRQLLLPPHQPKLVDHGTVGYAQLRQGRYQVSQTPSQITPMQRNAYANRKPEQRAGYATPSSAGVPSARGPSPLLSGSPIRQLTTEQDAQIRKLFNQYDRSKTGLLDRDGFMAVCAKLGRKLTVKEASTIIQTINPELRTCMDYRAFVVWWTTGTRAESF